LVEKRQKPAHSALSQIAFQPRGKPVVITAAHITPRVALIAGVLILDAEDLEQLVTRYKKRIEEETGKPFPQDPHAQLWGAIGAVFGSWSLHRPFHPLLALFLFWLRQEAKGLRPWQL
jgi:hypothetical protein